MGLRTAALAVLGANLAGPAVAAAPRIAPFYATSDRDKPIAGAGTSIFSGYLSSLDPNTDLRGEKWYGSPGTLGVSRKMRNDGQVRQSICYVTDPLCAATWRFRPASDDPRDREVAEFLTWCLIERLPWVSTLERIMGDAFADGFSLNELTEASAPIPRGRFPLHPGRGSGIIPTGIHEIPAATVYRWFQSKAIPTQLEGVEQYILGSDTEAPGFRRIPADRFIRWTYNQHAAEFAGHPGLRSAYGPWWLKQGFLKIWAIKHERNGVGTPVAIMGEDTSDPDKDAAQLALKEMRANERGHLVLPHGCLFDWKNATSSDGTNLELALQICDNAIAQNVSAGFMQLGLASKSGSYALSGTQQGQYHLSVKKHAAFYALGWNLGVDGWSAVERIARLNYGPDVGVPVLEARSLPTADWAMKAPLATNALNVGGLTYDKHIERFYREGLEIDPLDESTARERTGPQVALVPEDPSKRDEQREQEPEDDDAEEAA